MWWLNSLVRDSSRVGNLKKRGFHNEYLHLGTLEREATLFMSCLLLVASASIDIFLISKLEFQEHFLFASKVAMFLVCVGCLDIYRFHIFLTDCLVYYTQSFKKKINDVCLQVILWIHIFISDQEKRFIYLYVIVCACVYIN